MLQVTTKLPDKSFFIRLNSVPNATDTVTDDVVHHLRRWMKAQRDKKNKNSNGRII